jgi:hypothetical protein
MRYSQLYTVPPCLSGGEGCVICPIILVQTAVSVGRINDAVFPSVSKEGETTHAKAVTNCVCNFARFYFKDDQMCQIHTNERQIVPLGPRRFTKRS